MRRRVFNILSAVSLAMCLATAALWVRSYRHYDGTFYISGMHDRMRQTAVELASMKSTTRFMYVLQEAQRRGDPGGPRTGLQTVSSFIPPGVDPLGRVRQDGYWVVGFGYLRTDATDARDSAWPRTMTMREVYIPDWTLVLIFAALPARRAMQWRRNRRRGAGLCPACGYDLRATPERCPECGRESGEARMTKPEARMKPE